MASNTVYRVSTVLADPFVTKGSGGTYEGYLVDMLDKMANYAGFRYTLAPSGDGAYGMELPNGRWTGVIGELLRNDTDIAAAALTITQTRERVVSFTKPFMSQTVRLLTSKPERADDNLTLILQPFSATLWVSILIAIAVVGLLFVLINRFNPYEWSQVPGEKDPRGARHSFGLRGSYMFVFSIFTLQGFRETPRSLSGRTLAVTWFIFSFFIIVVYIANLFSFVTADKSPTPLGFDDIDDIMNENRVRVLAVRNGNTFQSFKRSKVQAYQQLARYMEKYDSFVNTTKEGLNLIRRNRGGYTMLVESSVAEFVIQRKPCDMMMVGNPFFQQGMGLATRHRFPLLRKLNEAILSLREDGTLQMLQKKWFYDKGECPVTQARGSEDHHTAHTLSLSHASGAFIILIVGVVLSVVALVGEILFKRRRS